jgi:hypothetical protein
MLATVRQFSLNQSPTRSFVRELELAAPVTVRQWCVYRRGA